MTFMQWLFKQLPAVRERLYKAQQDCMTPKESDGPIEVIAPQLPPRLTLCMFGGLLHCSHGAERCCWCKIRSAKAN